MPVRSLLTLLVALALGLGLGCAPSENKHGETRRTALLPLLENAEIRAEPGRIDFGTPSAHRFLVSGWSRDEGRDEAHFVWGLGQGSTLSFFLQRPRDLELRARLRPAPHPEGQTQQVTLRLGEDGGEDIQTWDLAPGFQEVSALLPSRALSAGSQTLSFVYAHAVTPRSLGGGSSDARELAVAWDWLTFASPGDQPAEAEAWTDEDQLFLPAGGEVDLFLAPDSPWALGFPSIEAFDGFVGHLEVSLATDASPDLLTRSLAPDREGEILAIDHPGPLRLRLAAVRREAEASAGTKPGKQAGLLLTAPFYESQPPPTPAIAPEPSSPVPGRPNLILYVVDTLRADRLGCYGYDRPVSPAIDRFADESILFERAVAQSSWTKASVASMFTGLWPYAHRTNLLENRIPDDLPTLAEALAEAGYRTGAVSANGYVSDAFDFDRGFEHFQFFSNKLTLAPTIHEAALDWLDELSKKAPEPHASEPFFLYLQPIDPHGPYFPPEETRARFAPDVEDPDLGSVRSLRQIKKNPNGIDENLRRGVSDLYDAEIAAFDRDFGTFIEALRARGLLETTVLAFVSDHGEEFAEHGEWTHGLNLFGETLQVPMILRFPEGPRGVRVAEPAQHIDLHKTLLAQAGLHTALSQGRDLSPDSVLESEPVFSYLQYFARRAASVIDGEWKLIVPYTRNLGSSPQLYHLGRDPLETTDVAADFPVRTGYLLRLLHEKERAAEAMFAEDATTEINAETEEQLRALGYL